MLNEKRKPLIFKILAAFIAVVMIFNLNILPALTIFAADGTCGVSATSEDRGARPPTSVNDIKIPTVDKNPYDVSVGHKNYRYLIMTALISSAAMKRAAGL